MGTHPRKSYIEITTTKKSPKRNALNEKLRDIGNDLNVLSKMDNVEESSFTVFPPHFKDSCFFRRFRYALLYSPSHFNEIFPALNIQ